MSLTIENMDSDDLAVVQIEENPVEPIQQPPNKMIGGIN